MSKKINLSLSTCLLSSIMIVGCSQQQTQGMSPTDQQVMDQQIPKTVTPAEPVATQVPVYRPMVKPKQVHKIRPMVKPKQVLKARPIY